jgi:hypothetical protein
MKPLCKAALKRIDAYDRDHWRNLPGTCNKTRFYNFLTKSGRDVEIHTVAMRMRKDGTPCIKEVVRASVDSPWVSVTDMVFYPISGYIVDWSKEGLGRIPDYWGYDGKWQTDAYNRKSGLWKLYRPIVNIEVLQKSKRFRWCTYSSACGHLIDYLKTYTAHPKVELLAKLGLGRFAAMPGFVKTLTTNKRFLQFFMQNLEEIKAKKHGASEIRMAFSRKVTLAEAVKILTDIRRFAGTGLPKHIGATRAAQYVNSRPRQINGEYHYTQYLGLCMKLGMNLKDTKVAFPKNFKARMAEVSDRVDAIERAERAEADARERAERAARREEINKALAATAKKLAKVARIKGPYKVVVPTDEEAFIKEGKHHGNCVGGYAGRCSRGEQVLFFIRKLDKPQVPFVVAEYFPRTGKLGQCYEGNNRNPSKAVIDFVENRVVKTANRIKLTA